MNDLRKIGNQLRCPSGEAGIEMGHVMNESNISLTRKTFSRLEFRDEMHIMELGHGNAGHVSELLSLANGLQYRGLDISETMHAEAKLMNEISLDEGKASFHLYDGKHIPFEKGQFDRFFTVNTLYFWEEPHTFFNSLARVLKPDGLGVVTFCLKRFMKKVPFVGEQFTLYSSDDFKNLIRDSDFQIQSLEEFSNQVVSKDGKEHKREYAVAVLAKRV